MPYYPFDLSGGASGISFPIAPTTNDRFYRTDRSIEYYYDGTRWLSTQLHHVNVSMTNAAGLAVSTFNLVSLPLLPEYDLYLVSWGSSVFRGAAGEWDVVLNRVDAANTVTAIDTQDGSADATTTWINRSRSLGTLLQAATTKLLRVDYSEISGTATLLAAASVSFRLVG